MHSLDTISTPSPKQIQDKQHKIKRLRTRKERCQMRADKRETSKNKSHHHHCFSQSKKNLIFYPNNHHNCHLPTRKNAQILSTVAVTQEPSIITESRLLGHHGLFNHEVKSINIERVLSEQSKLEESEEKTNEETNDTPYLSSTPSNLILLSSDGLLESDLLDLFQNNFVNQTRNLRERLSEQQPHHSNVQPFFSHQDRHSADLHVFPREQNPSKTDRFYFAPFFPSKSHRRSQSNHLQGFGQFSPVHQNFRPDPTDMMHYPPSHMLERNLVPPSSSLPSPEHWSFPPMRLY
uniref:Uncharacterized protein n=1 Tax=Poecilia latipinna TaxID=48699 RepID=A0A3B3U0H5_9TELE